MISVDVLILGAGWTSLFLVPLLNEKNTPYAATTRSGKEGTLKFEFNESTQKDDFRILPEARTVLITFPIRWTGGSKSLVEFYKETHPDADVRFIQLGSTGIFDGSPTAQGKATVIWSDRHSPYNKEDPRAVAEDELLSLSKTIPTTVLLLSGLWGGTRQPRNWITRMAPSKEALGNKTSLHLIHGEDVAHAIIAIHEQFDRATGSRWILTDGRVYDVWELASAWGDGGDATRGKDPWVRELMQENGVRALPRDIESLGRALDSREFWTTFGLTPLRARVD
ncbi:hypothetical protein BU17DRAFT_49473 [Hysterangium stoloniferum]|nr:hypothetical protein BU17DRAFT_49473 [Hysterangium stoloniferum]